MTDAYGRLSYVYCDFYGKRIPVLQPGGFRIESGAKYESKLAILDNGVWVNGFVLGLG